MCSFDFWAVGLGFVDRGKKRKVPYYRKRKFSFRDSFTGIHCSIFVSVSRIKVSLFVSALQNSVSVSIFPFRFRFFAERSERFRSVCIPTHDA